MCPYIRVGALTFESYTLLTYFGTVSGFFAEYLVLDRYCRREKHGWKMILFLLVMMVIGEPCSRFLKGLFGGAGNDGTHFLARVLLACMFMPLFLRVAWNDEQTKQQALNSAALYFLIQHFFNRIACWMNGCCGGIYVEKIGVRVCTQLLEAGMMEVMLLFLLRAIRKEIPFFQIACTYYALVIWVSEYLIDQPETVRILSMNSIQAAAVLLILIVQIPNLKRRKKTVTSHC